MKTQIHTLVEPIIREKIEKSFFSGTVFEELIENLAFEMSIRTLIFELNYQKPCLKGTDDKDKYLCFLQKFEEKDYQCYRPLTLTKYKSACLSRRCSVYCQSV